jgi:hypothetical protein
LAFNTNLFGALTHYSSGQAAVYFGGLSLYFFAPGRHFSGYSLAIILTCHLECLYPFAFAHRV